MSANFLKRVIHVLALLLKSHDQYLPDVGSFPGCPKTLKDDSKF